VTDFAETFPVDMSDQPVWQTVSDFCAAGNDLLDEFYKHRQTIPEDSSYEAVLMGKIETTTAHFRKVAAALLLEAGDPHEGTKELAHLWRADDTSRRANVALLCGVRTFKVDSVDTFLKMIDGSSATTVDEEAAVDEVESIYLLRANDVLGNYAEFIDEKRRKKETRDRLQNFAGKFTVASVVVATGLLARRYLDQRLK
jgi:hypothetical protein